MSDTSACTREGYPVVDENHPLWPDQQAGWPQHTAADAMRDAIRLRDKAFVNSASHPAYASDYIVNPTATRPKDEPAAAVSSREKARR